jgi:POT family proton-dependent oligopeptide transporter
MILGHPAGLLNLFLTEMWERFSFYGMRAILVLFLVAPHSDDGLGLRLTTAAALYSGYNVVVYLLALPGGWVADRLIGTRRAVLVGGIIIATGHYVLAIPAGVTVYLGLMLVALGTGLLKPNISAMVGELYDQLPDSHHAKRDSGFSLFYLAINVGAWGGVLVTGWLAQRYGWHVGFAAAAIGMTIAVVQYVASERMLGDVGLEARRPLDAYRRSPTLRRAATLAVIGLIALVTASALLAAVTGRSMVDSVLLLIPPIVVAVPILFFRTMLGEHTLTEAERSRVRAYVPIFLGATLFWMIYDQAGNLLNLFAADKVDNRIFGLDFPAAWYLSVNPLLILILAPLFAVMWARLGERAPSTPVKFAIALMGIGGSFLIMGSAGAVAAQGQISPLWLLSVYLVQTVAELFLAPIGLSVTTKLAPARFASQMMGLWFLATATGNAVGGYVVRLSSTLSDAVYYGLLGVLGVVAGCLFPPRRRVKLTDGGV